MYVIDRLEATDFLSYDHLDLPFKGKSVVLIEGMNGSGKSALVGEIPSYAAYGKFLRRLGKQTPPEEIVRFLCTGGNRIAIPGVDEAGTILHLSQYGVENPDLIRIERYLSKSGKKKVKLFVNGDHRKFDKNTDADDAIEKWLGIDFEMLMRRFLTPENTSFLTLDPSVRFKVLSNLLAFDWDKVYSDANNKLKKIQELIAIIETDIRNSEAEKVRLDAQRDLITFKKTQYEDQVVKLTKSISDQKLAIDGKKNDNKDLFELELSKREQKCEAEEAESKQREVLSKLQSELSTAKLNKNKLESQKEMITFKKAQYEEQLKNIELKKEEQLKLQESKKLELEPLTSSITELEKEKEQRGYILGLVKDSIYKLRSELLGIDIQTAEKQIHKQFASIGVIECPKCNSKIDSKSISERMFAVKREELEARAIEIKKELESPEKNLLEDEPKLTDVTNRHSEVVKSKSKLEGEIQGISNVLSSLVKETKKLEESELAKAINEFKKSGLTIEDIDKQLEGIGVDIFRLECSIKSAETDLAFNTEAVEKLRKQHSLLSNKKSAVEGELKSMSEALDKAQKEFDCLGKSELSSSVQSLKETELALKEMTDKLLTLNDKLTAEKKRMTAVLIVKSSSQPSSNARIRSINKLIPYFSEGVSKIATHMFARQIDVDFKVDDRELIISSPQLSLLMKSTGEARSIDIAVALTIQEIALQTSRNQIGFFIGDELFDSLDGTRAQAALALLRGLKIPQLFISTHDEKIKQALELTPGVDVLHVVNEDGVSRATFRN
jgi:DNA repair exonuclease SbcCD ATPase subunit